MPDIHFSPKQEKKLLFSAFFSSPFASIIGSVLTTLAIGAILLKVSGPVPISVTQTTIDKQSGFEVSGEGSALIIPDQATIVLEVKEQNKDVVQAKNSATLKVDTLKANLENLRVPRENISTLVYEITPNYSLSEPKVIQSYEVVTQLEVGLPTLELLDESLQEAAKQDAKLAGEVTFGVSKEKRARAEDWAREAAITQARGKAGRIAAKAGVEIARVTDIDEKVTTNALTDGQTGKTKTGASKITVSVTLSFETK